VEPKQKPGKSKQDYETPWEFIRAVEQRFGSLTWDLAANEQNRKADLFIGEDQNALSMCWGILSGNLWLNPPFGKISLWAEKCAITQRAMGRILLLVPASVGSNWFASHVHNKALVLALAPRISFDGKSSFPKDLMLCVYGAETGFDIWRWRK
jgi:phage N-6-adenine-methyltransferase